MPLDMPHPQKEDVQGRGAISKDKRSQKARGLLGGAAIKGAGVTGRKVNVLRRKTGRANTNANQNPSNTGENVKAEK